MDSPDVFRGMVTGVIDGDTFKAWVDQGLGIWNRGITKAQDGLSIRLFGANARELEEEGGPEARDHLETLLPTWSEVQIISHRWDKFAGRLDADVILDDGTWLVPTLMRDQWLAGPYYGAGPKPVPPWPRTTP